MNTNKNMFSFKYNIVRKKRKTIGIKVTNKGEVIITSPFGISEEAINSIVKEREKWILEKVSIMKNKSLNRNTILDKGYKLLYLGKEYEVELNYEDKITYDFYIEHGKLEAFLDKSISVTEETVKNHIIKMYKKEAEKILLERTKIYSKIINVYPYKITIKSQHTIWGSCSSKKNINYNYKIIMAPIEIIDYIVVHELCHLVHMNHSQKYWDTVENILPDYKIRDQWLKQNGFKLMRSLE